MLSSNLFILIWWFFSSVICTNMKTVAFDHLFAEEVVFMYLIFINLNNLAKKKMEFEHATKNGNDILSEYNLTPSQHKMIGRSDFGIHEKQKNYLS